MSELFSYKTLALGVFCGALGIATALPIAYWGNEKSPEFYGAFAAALIAATALIFSSYYQSRLSQQREEKQRQEGRIAEAIELCFWLDHCDSEFEFIANFLVRLRDELIRDSKSKTSIPPLQFREIISSHFFDELLQKAQVASRLPVEIAADVVENIYRTYTTVDRIFRLRGASDSFQPSLENLHNYIFVVESRRNKLQTSARLIERYLVQIGAIPKSIETKS